MRVVHVHRIGGIGGSERHLLALLPALRGRGVDASFLGLDDHSLAPEPFYAALASSGVPFERVPCPRDLDPALACRVAGRMRRLRPDLVHGHLVHGDVYAAVGAIAAGARLVSTKHNDDPFRSGRFRHVERLLARRTARILCITEALRRFSIERVGLPAAKLETVHYGLDAPPAAWGEPGGPALAPGVPVVAAVCRLEEQKGLDVAIRALARLDVRGERPHLVVLGEGPLRAQLERQAREAGLSGRVHLPGRVGDVAWWLRRSAVVVHPARWEGFGLALLEAMLCERAVVATRVSSIPEIVEDGATGLLVPVDDDRALAAALQRLLDDPGRAAALGRAGLERARSAFSVARMADRTVAAYRRALASASS